MQLALLQKEIVLPPLRDYQQRLRSDVYRIVGANRDAACRDRTMVIVMPTGAGKTLTATRFMVDGFTNSGRQSIFIVPMTCLVKQTYETFQRYNVDAGVIAASWGKNPHPDAPIQIASIDTLSNRQIPPNIGLVIVDEAHTCGFAPTHRWLWALNADGTWKHWTSDAWILGFTATPWRTKKTESLSELYRHLVVGSQARELMELGERTDYTEGLTRAVYYSFPKAKQLNLAGIKTQMGDYDTQQLAIAVDNDETTLNLIHQWLKLCVRDGQLRGSRRTAFFGVNVNHSRKVAEKVNAFFRDQAIDEGFEDGRIAVHLDGNAPTEEREYWYEKLKSGEILWFCSVDIASTGFDVPEIECVIPRPTKSKVNNIQQVGRGARCAPWIGKTDFYVLDVGRNAENYKIGRIDDIQDYSLDAEPSDPGEAPMKQCPSCDAFVYAVLQNCSECGHEFEFEVKTKEVPTGDMEVVLSKEDLARKRFYQSKAKAAFRRGYMPGYALMQFKEKFGQFPSTIHKLHAVFDEEDVTEEAMRDYWRYLCDMAQEKDKDEKWCRRFYKEEFGIKALDPALFTG